MKGIIIQFRRGRKTVHERHYLLDLGLKDRAEAKKYAGKEVEWKSPAGKIIKGKISDAHGNNGVLRAIFERGLPGQAITSDGEGKGAEDVKGEKKEKDKVEVKEEKVEKKEEGK